MTLTRFTNKLKHPLFWKNFGWGLFRFALFTGIIFVLIYPILSVFSGSFKSYSDMINPTTIWIPKEPTLQNYIDAIQKVKYFDGLRNTAILSIACAVGQTLSCALVGYGFARYNFKEKGLLFGVMLFILIVTPQTISLPKVMIFKSMGMIDTLWPMILPSFFGLGLKSGIFIYIYRQIFSGMPREFEEAAYLDGCGDFRIFARIMLPNAIPAIVTVCLFSLVWNWNEVFEPTTYLQTPDMMTLSMRLINVNGFITQEAGVVKDLVYVIPIRYACIILVIAPMLVFYAIVQRKFVESVERSGIVG
ncbi:MAG: carbohydrate ABC transporter permease [Oscillospiraceae bacterium]|nr:carbohydrate ABC transporter permease [Oscillospiraceae bacterium]